MTADRPTQSPTFLVSGAFFLTCLSIATFKLTFRPLLGADATGQGASFQLVEILAQAGTMMLLVILERLSQATPRQIAAVLLAGAAAQTAGALIAVLAPGAATPLAETAYVLKGAGSAPFLLALGWVLGSMAPARSALCIAGGQLCVELIALAQGAFPAGAAAVAVCLQPAATALFLLLTLRTVPLARDSRDSSEPVRIAGNGAECLCLLAICATSKIAIALFASIETPDDGLLYRLIAIAICLGVFLAYAVWTYLLRHSDPDRLWPFLMLVVFAGLFACSSLSAMAPHFAATVLSATQKTIMLFAWVFLASVIYRRKLPAVPVFCLGQLAFAQAPYLVASFITLNGLGAQGGDEPVLTVATTAILALAVIVGVMAVVSKGGPDKDAAAPPPSPDAALKEAVDALARDHSLSEREAEVALLVAKGYTLSACGEILHISLNTVRVHARNLYKKLGIHKKSELLHLLERTDEPPTA